MANAQDQILLKYDYGHKIINTKNIDRVKKGLFKNNANLSIDFILASCQAKDTLQ